MQVTHNVFPDVSDATTTALLAALQRAYVHSGYFQHSILLGGGPDFEALLLLTCDIEALENGELQTWALRDMSRLGDSDFGEVWALEVETAQLDVATLALHVIAEYTQYAVER